LKQTRVLKKQILEVPHEYLQSLADDLLGFTNVNPRRTHTSHRTTVPSPKMILETAKLSLPGIQIRPSKRFHRSCCGATVRNRRWRSDLGCHRHSQSPQDLQKSGVFDTAVNGVSSPWPITYANLLPFFRSRNIERMRT
jgi:hypothetical protein